MLEAGAFYPEVSDDNHCDLVNDSDGQNTFITQFLMQI